MITKAYVDFFTELEQNNYKEWFHANKNRYEQHVKAPFHSLVEELIPVLLSIDAEIPEDPKSIIMRINKDIRFSKDKTPYNLMMKANFTPGGRKSINPGFYLGISATDIHIGGGLYHPSPQDLKRIRGYLLDHAGEWKGIVSDDAFTKNFQEIKGDKAKRIDKEWMAAAEEMPVLYHKQFFYMRQLPLNDFLGSRLPEVLTPFLRSCQQVHAFLKEAVTASS